MIYLILMLGIITSYTDIKYGKIRNLHLALVFLLGLAYSFWQKIPVFDINIALALLTGYMLWYVGIWTSGDAKLYMVYAFLLSGMNDTFSSVSILANTFIPFFLFYFTRLLFLVPKKKLSSTLKSSFSPKKIAELVFILFALTWPIHLLSNILAEPFPQIAELFKNLFVVILFLFIMFRVIQTAFNVTKIMIVIALLRLIFDRSIWGMDFMLEFSLMLFIFIVARFFVLELTHSVYSKQIDIHLLRPGMILSDRILKKEGKYKKEPGLYFSLFSYLAKPKNLFGDSSEGLSKKDCRVLRKLKRDNLLLFDHVGVYETLPFALYLFVGVLITVLVHGNVFILLFGSLRI